MTLVIYEGPSESGIIVSGAGRYVAARGVAIDVPASVAANLPSGWVLQTPSSVVLDSSGANAPLIDAFGNPIVNIPTFQGNTTYPAGFVIVQSGTLYSRNSQGTSLTTWAGDSANWSVVGTVNETALTLSDVTTDNVSTSAHGFQKKLSGLVTDVAAGDGAYAPVNGPQRGVSISADFYSASGNLNPPWNGLAVSSGSIGGALGDLNRPGVVAMNAAATTIGSGYCWDADHINLNGGEITEAVFKIALTTSTTVYFGLHDSKSATVPSNGCWINIAGTTVSGIAATAGTQTATGTTFTLTQGNWYHGKVVVNSNGTANFYLYDSTGSTLLWSDAVASNVPGNTVSVNSTIVVTTGASQASQTTLLYLDYLGLVIARALAR